jgi:metal transporter CNNM
VRQKGNLLLCTLLLGGTILNSAISIILSSVTSGVVGLMVSTFVILILGAAGSVPPAVPQRDGLLVSPRVYHGVTMTGQC